jgi:WD40 repeat protein
MKRIKGTSLVACGLTDGRLLLAKIEAEGLYVLLTELAHDFGVNCVDSLSIEGGFLVVSGGDDQHIRVAHYSNEGILTAFSRKHAHSSCVKGVSIYQKAGKIFVASSGYDQRLSYWAVETSQGSLNLRKQALVRHCLSDMNGMCKSGDHLVLAGQGLALFKK